MTLKDLQSHVETQIKNIFAYDIFLDYESVQLANQKVQDVLRRSCNRYIETQKTNDACFSVFNTCHYCIFIYFLSNIIYKRDKNGTNAEKLYYLNKVLNCVDIFYEIELPNLFYVEHPVGSIIGRAKKIGDYFFFHQGCTVGENFGSFPTIGKNVTMFADSKILGNSVIGDNVILSANSYVINETIPDNSIVFGQSPNLIIKTYDEKYIKTKLQRFWNY